AENIIFTVRYSARGIAFGNGAPTYFTRVVNIAEGAALATGCKAAHRHIQNIVEDLVPNEVLEDISCGTNYLPNYSYL
ncbi:MAG: hypothetical protein RSD26_11980, partial [Cellulosilyticaceae bacterium]